VADQSIHSDGFRHQNDIKRRRDSCGWSLGVAGDRTVGTDFQLSAFPLTDNPGPGGMSNACRGRSGLARWQDVPHSVHPYAAANTPAGNNQCRNNVFGKVTHLGTVEFAFETGVAGF
jgi:hypothetical protein